MPETGQFIKERNKSPQFGSRGARDQGAARLVSSEACSLLSRQFPSLYPQREGQNARSIWMLPSSLLYKVTNRVPRAPSFNALTLASGFNTRTRGHSDCSKGATVLGLPIHEYVFMFIWIFFILTILTLHFRV